VKLIQGLSGAIVRLGTGGWRGQVIRLSVAPLDELGESLQGEKVRFRKGAWVRVGDGTILIQLSRISWVEEPVTRHRLYERAV